MALMYGALLSASPSGTLVASPPDTLANTLVENPPKYDAFGELVISPESTDNIEEEAVIYRSTSEIEPNFSGFMVEIIYSDTRLHSKHKVLHNYGNIFLDGDVEEGYSYMIGTFTSKDGAKDFFKKIILPAEPNARIVRYQNGKKKYVKVK